MNVTFEGVPRPDRSMSLRRLVSVGALCCLGLTVAGAAGLAACGSGAADRLTTVQASADEVADLVFTVPAGTGERLDAGETLELVPAVIEARVGDVIQLTNDDDRSYLIGPFYVGPHESVRQRFSSAGTFVGECAVHPSGTVSVVVTDEG
ncbi:MAG: hypothetical protein R2715_13760 [Ilumatobacteraceae bacterium]